MSSDNQGGQGFWTSMNGVVTAIAGLLTAAAGLLVALYQVGGTRPAPWSAHDAR